MATRSRLVARCGTAPVTVLLSAAGFGKTTLLRSWRDQLAGDVRSAIVGFEAHPRANARDAATALVGAAVQLGAPRCDDLLALVPADGAALGLDFVRALAGRLRHVPHRTVLLLDDVHALARPTAIDLGRLVSLVADGAHLVGVASRSDPPWPIGRWRVAGFCQVLTGADLRFTPDEASAMLPDVSTPQLDAVMRATEGWAAALEAVRWRLQVDPDTRIDGAAADMVGYVVDEVVSHLGARELRFLQRTAVLHHFTERVAAAVADDAGAAALLVELARRTSLVTSSDGTWDYHPMLRGALRHRLAVEEPGAERALHRRAADAWLDESSSFATTGQVIDHLLHAEDWVTLRELLRARWAEFYEHSRLDVLVDVTERIPDRWWRDDVGMVLIHAWANVQIGRSHRAVEGFHSPVVTGHPIGRAVGQIAFSQGTWWSTDPVEALQLVERGLEQLRAIERPVEFPDFPGYHDATSFELVAELSAAKAAALVGRLDDAVERLDALLRRSSAMLPRTTMHTQATLALVVALQGECDRSAQHARDALTIADEIGLSHHVLVAPAHLALGVVAASVGDPRRGLEHVDEAARRSRPVRAAGLLRCCQLVAAMCADPDRALLGDVDPPAPPAPLPLVDQFVVAATARRRASLGDHAGAENHLRTSTPHELTLSAWVEVMLGVFDRRWVHRWVRSRPAPTCLRGRIARWLTEATTTDHVDEARELVRLAADAASPQRLVGVLLDAPAPLWTRDAAQRCDHPLVVEALTRHRAAADEGPVSFTDRELELLRLLATPLRVAELADRLFVSVNTVKWHKANIYRKLGVKDREQALVRAVELGLLGPADAPG